MKKRKLGTKVIILMVIFSLLIIVSTCIAVVVRYREDALERSRGHADRRLPMQRRQQLILMETGSKGT